MDNDDQKMPVLFLGHGSPMNAIEDNEFTRGWSKVAQDIPVPRSILCISAHWETNGTQVTAMENPRTIHDFYGFPSKLFEVHYPAPGDPELANELQHTIKDPAIGSDFGWGLDHGAWSVIRHLYPGATVPVVQLSLDRMKDAAWHFDFGKQLAFLRENGVLVIGSGNMVHNLRLIDWRNPEGGYDWAQEAHHILTELISKGDFISLSNYHALGKEVGLAIPTPEHYLPLLYTLALKSEKDTITLFNDKLMMGSLAMTSILIK